MLPKCDQILTKFHHSGEILSQEILMVFSIGQVWSDFDEISPLGWKFKSGNLEFFYYWAKFWTH